jgi:hypothetical protein
MPKTDPQSWIKPVACLSGGDFYQAPVNNRRAGWQPAPQRSRAATNAAC